MPVRRLNADLRKDFFCITDLDGSGLVRKLILSANMWLIRLSDLFVKYFVRIEQSCEKDSTIPLKTSKQNIEVIQ